MKTKYWIEIFYSKIDHPSPKGSLLLLYGHFYATLFYIPLNWDYQSANYLPISFKGTHVFRRNSTFHHSLELLTTLGIMTPKVP